MLKKLLLIAIAFAVCSALPGRLSDLQSYGQYLPAERAGRGRASERDAFLDQRNNNEIGYEESLTKLHAPSLDGQGYRDPGGHHSENGQFQRPDGQFHEGPNQRNGYQGRNGYDQRRNGYPRDGPSQRHNYYQERNGDNNGYQNGHNSFRFRNQMNDYEGQGMYAPRYPVYDSGNDVSMSCFESSRCGKKLSEENSIFNERPNTEPYQFEYAVRQPFDNLNFGHTEEVKRPGAIQGSYRVLLPDGRMQRVDYIADENGYHPTISYSEARGERYSNSEGNFNSDYDQNYGNFDGNSDNPNSGPY